MTSRWEYKTIALEATGWVAGGEVDIRVLDAELNRLGSDGWELVSAFDTNKFKGQTRDVIVILKRPVS